MTVYLIVGPRFAITREEIANQLSGVPGLRAGTRGSYVIERAPIAGPIIRVEVDKKFHALCTNCRQYGKRYTRKREPGMFTWAYDHRCPRNEVEFIGRGVTG